MSTIRFTAYFCGMSEDLFADNMMIYKPFSSYTKTYTVENVFAFWRVSDIINAFKADASCDGNVLGDWGNQNLQVNTVYIQAEDALLGLQDDKILSDIFSYFGSDCINFVYICVVGGASFWCDGYRFTVHPNEDIHRHHPHVHVKRDDQETRYSLDTLTRFPNDTFSREFKRDEKKIILPYLRKNQAKLRRYWDYYLNGFIPPTENSNGKQFYN